MKPELTRIGERRWGKRRIPLLQMPGAAPSTASLAPYGLIPFYGAGVSPSPIVAIVTGDGVDVPVFTATNDP